LVSEGKASFSDPVGKHIKGLDPAIARLTVNQILSHTSGLQDTAVMNGRHDDAALGEEIRAWKADWLFTQPGKIYSYSNPGFWLAGLLAETIDGKPFADVMQARIFAPLGMVSSTLRPTMAMTRPISQGHDFVDKRLNVLRPAPDNSANWPAGSVFSNLADLARFATALMDGGKLDGRQVLPNDAIVAMTSPHADIPGTKTKYGYGLVVEGAGDARQWNHAGSRAGYGSYIGMIPGSHTAMIVLCNRTGENLPRLRSVVLTMLGRPQTGIGEVEPSPIPKSAFPRYVGMYRNGENRKEIVEREGKLFLDTAELWRQSGDSLILKEQNGAPAARIVMVPGQDGPADYLFQGGRSLARVH
jgi:CubicO group peptidase (beta-lactamase class C family)